MSRTAEQLPKSITVSVSSSGFTLETAAFLAVSYHPPWPPYKPEELLNYMENCVTEISRDFLLSDIVLVGDFNQLSDRDVVEGTGLTQIVHRPADAMY